MASVATTLIRNCDWIVAYDPDKDGHCYIRGGDIAWSGDSITFVGKDYTGEAATTSGHGRPRHSATEGEGGVSGLTRSEPPPWSETT